MLLCNSRSTFMQLKGFSSSAFRRWSNSGSHQPRRPISSPTMRWALASVDATCSLPPCCVRAFCSCVRAIPSEIVPRSDTTHRAESLFNGPIKGGTVSAGLTPADVSANKMDERNDTRNATGCQKEKNDEFKLGQRPSGSSRGDLLLANIH